MSESPISPIEIKELAVDVAASPSSSLRVRGLFTLSSSSPSRGLSISTRPSPLERSLIIHRDHIEQTYILGQRIGNPGGFGYAMHATVRASGEKRAVKVIHKRKVQEDLEKLRREVSIHGSLSHPNVVRCYEAYENDESLFIVMEVCSGGELYDRIAEKKRFSENEARKTFTQVVQGVKYLHDHKIAHCDLKPDNILFQDNSEDSPPKIIDFGMASHLKQRQYLSHFTGTSYYIAPEVHGKHYTISVDIWSLGVILFVLVFGFPPFNGKNPKEIHNATRKGFDPRVRKGWGAWFPEARPASDLVCDLIGKMLRSEAEKRLTAGEILQHPWVTEQRISDKPLEHLMSYLKVYHVEKMLKTELLKAMREDESVNQSILSPTDLKELEKSFKKLDKTGKGKITVTELASALRCLDQSSTIISSASSLSRMRSEEMMEHLSALLKAADIDGDGSLGYEDMITAAVHSHLVRKEERLWALFSKMDVDKDGKLSRDELASHLGVEVEMAQAMLDEIEDKNEGSIDYQQFLGMWTNQKSKQLWSLVSPGPGNGQEEEQHIHLVSSVLTDSVETKDKPPSPHFPDDESSNSVSRLSMFPEDDSRQNSVEVGGELVERQVPATLRRVTSPFMLNIGNKPPSQAFFKIPEHGVEEEKDKTTDKDAEE
eukprot:gb/GEZN01001480.1/.p1 GENE.gb/GEZN01001480.1/~~gb/GEZN01001480.1/.p1  ORF type:complete len:657 (-),score=65.58 gb/GEZN01001480.1/:888-2858(-)